MGRCCDGRFPYGKDACAFEQETPKWGRVIPLLLLGIPVLGYLLSL